MKADAWKKRLCVLCTRGLVKQDAVRLEGKLTAMFATGVMLEVYALNKSLPDCICVINSLLAL